MKNVRSFLFMTFFTIAIFGLVILGIREIQSDVEDKEETMTIVEESVVKNTVETKEAVESSPPPPLPPQPVSTPPEPEDASKTLFEKGKTLFDDGMYLEAIEELAMIKEEDKFYQEGQEILGEAVKTYREEMHGKVDLLVEEGNREEAIRVLRELIYRLPVDEMTNRKLQENIDSYKEQLLASIDTTYETEGVDAVVQLLMEGNRVITNDIDIKNELKKWETRKTPIYLCDMEYFSKGESICAESSGAALVDNYENSYSSGIDQTLHRWVLPAIDDIEYYLGGEYAKFSGTVYVTKEARSLGVDKWDGIGIEVYADDVLIEAYTGLGYKSEPIDFELDVRDTEFLKIRFGGCYFGGWSDPLIVLGEGRVGW